MPDYSGGGGGGVRSFNGLQGAVTGVGTFDGRTGTVVAQTSDVPQVPQLVGTPATATATATAITVNKPAGNLIAGDMIVAAIQGNGSTNAPGTPSGWTLRLTSSNGTATLWIYTYVALGGASDPASWTFSGLSQVANCTALTFAVRSYTGTVGIDQSLFNAGANLTLPSVTTTKLNQLLLGFFTTNGGGTAITVPVSMVPLQGVNNSNDTQQVGYQYQAALGATPTPSGSNGGATSTAAAVMTLYSA